MKLYGPPDGARWTWTAGLSRSLHTSAMERRLDLLEPHPQESLASQTVFRSSSS